MKKFVILSVVLISGISGQASAEPTKVVPGNELYQPIAMLRSCNRTEPRGYLWVGGSYNPDCVSISGNNWAYQFESYFDKPVGFWMTVCSDESIVPDGWFVNSYAQFSGCVDGRFLVPVIQRYY